LYLGSRRNDGDGEVVASISRSRGGRSGGGGEEPRSEGRYFINITDLNAGEDDGEEPEENHGGAAGNRDDEEERRHKD
jgi:hypothetical protein